MLIGNTTVNRQPLKSCDDCCGSNDSYLHIEGDEIIADTCGGSSIDISSFRIPISDNIKGKITLGSHESSVLKIDDGGVLTLAAKNSKILKYTEGACSVNLSYVLSMNVKYDNINLNKTVVSINFTLTPIGMYAYDWESTSVLSVFGDNVSTWSDFPNDITWSDLRNIGKQIDLDIFSFIGEFDAFKDDEGIFTSTFTIETGEHTGYDMTFTINYNLNTEELAIDVVDNKKYTYTTDRRYDSDFTIDVVSDSEFDIARNINNLFAEKYKSIYGLFVGVMNNDMKIVNPSSSVADICYMQSSTKNTYKI